MKEIEHYYRPQVINVLTMSGGDDIQEEVEPEMDDRPLSIDPQFGRYDGGHGSTNRTQ
jgi:hypothetical protein